LYGGWKSGKVTQSLEQLASTFSFEYVDRWEQGGEIWPIEEGDRCEVRVDDKKLVVGHVDDAVSRYGPKSWDLSVQGRSLLGDLVDCAVIRDSNQWLDATMADIIADVVQPFGIQTFQVGGGEAFRRFKFEPGETAAEVIQRAAKLRGFIATDLAGDLVLVRPPKNGPVDTLRRGDNIRSGQRRGSWRQRFSEYHYKGQTQGSDEVPGKSASQLGVKLTDNTVTRYRPTVVVSGGQQGPKDLEKRARAQRNRAAGESERLTYTVDGFTNRNDELWRPGQLVKVEDGWLRVDATVIVTRASMRFGPEQSMETQLELTRPEAFDDASYPEREKGETWTS
jgi:prophage tail gpP-like protein